MTRAGKLWTPGQDRCVHLLGAPTHMVCVKPRFQGWGGVTHRDQRKKHDKDLVKAKLMLMVLVTAVKGCLKNGNYIFEEGLA